MFPVLISVLISCLTFAALIIIWIVGHTRRQKNLADDGTLPESHDRIDIIVIKEGSRTYECGHSGPKSFKIDAYGSEMTPKGRKYCPDCAQKWFKENVIRCPICGLPIMPGDGVISYVPSNRMSHRKAGYVVPKGEVCEGAILGCLRWDCADTAAGLCGHWDGRKVQPLFSSGQSIVGEAFATGNVVCVDNIKTS